MDRRRTVFGVFDYIREELGPVMTEAITTRFSRTTTTAVPSSNSSEANTTTHVSREFYMYSWSPYTHCNLMDFSTHI